MKECVHQWGDWYTAGQPHRDCLLCGAAEVMNYSLDPDDKRITVIMPPPDRFKGISTKAIQDELEKREQG